MSERAIHLTPDEKQKSIQEMSVGDSAFTPFNTLLVGGQDNDLLMANRNVGVSKSPSQLECVKIEKVSAGAVSVDASLCTGDAQIRPRLWDDAYKGMIPV